MSTNIWIPASLRNTYKGLTEVNLRTSLMSKRNFFLDGEIDMDTANNFLIQMMYLSEEKEPVDIYINSEGDSGC